MWKWYKINLKLVYSKTTKHVIWLFPFCSTLSNEGLGRAGLRYRSPQMVENTRKVFDVVSCGILPSQAIS